MATGRIGAIDYSFDPPDDLAHYRQAHADGVRGFCRYLSPSSGKDFTTTELREIHSLGPDAFAHFLWEGYSNDALKGYNEGRVDGLAALGKISALQQSIGYKQRNVPGVSFAVDFDTNSGNWPALEAYFRGVRAAVGSKIRVGCYGEADIIDHLMSKGLIDFGFQTYAWSGLRITPNAALYQFLNGQRRWSATVDYCQVNDSRKLGAWFAPSSPYNVPYPSPVPVTDNSFMEMIMSFPDAPKSYAQFRADARADAHVGACAAHIDNNAGGSPSDLRYLQLLGFYWRPIPAKTASPAPMLESPDVPLAPLVAQNMHTDDPRATPPSNGAVSAIRTLVPLAVGALLTWLATTLHLVVGPGSKAELVAVADAVLTAGYWSLARLLEGKWPALGVLLGYPAQPNYSAKV